MVVLFVCGSVTLPSQQGLPSPVQNARHKIALTYPVADDAELVQGDKDKVLMVRAVVWIAGAVLLTLTLLQGQHSVLCVAGAAHPRL